MALAGINLTDHDQAELKDKLDAWRLQEKKKIEEELTEKYEQEEARLKEEYEELVEEIKDNMKKVYTKRFTKALKEMHSEIRAEILVEQQNSSELKVLDEVKALIYPFINEPTARRHKAEFEKLSEMYTESLADLSLLKGANKKAALLESLSPEVRKVVTKLLGEGNEVQIVEKFSAIKEALKEQASATNVTEDVDTYDDFLTEETHFEPEVKVTRKVREPKQTHIKKESREEKDYKNQLNEQLVLAGIK
jgi:hypothetical protein